MFFTQKQLKHTVIWLPIAFSFLYALGCYIYALAHASALTADMRADLQNDPLQVFWVSLLILIPNFLLSLIMYIYSHTGNFQGNLVLIPCFTAIIGGLIPVFYTYYFFYHIQNTGLTQISMLSYGFPFVYFLGMMIGWVCGIFTVALLSKDTSF